MLRSEARLEKLLLERVSATAAEKETIDRHIWDLFGEEWCIMNTDLSGFSRGVAQFGIIHFLQTIFEAERILVPVIESHDGLLLKVEGDSFFVIFRDVKKALRAAIEMQQAVRAYNNGRAAEEQVLLGVGLGYGRVLRIGDADVFGVEVNSACILGEDTACGFEILVTRAVREAASEVDGIRFEELDEAPPGAGSAFRVVYE